MTTALQRALRREKPFSSPAEQAFLGLTLASLRLAEPWTAYLKTHAGLTPAQYNVLRILRDARPHGVTCGEIADRVLNRDPDITRLIDRLSRSRLAERERDPDDRRIVRVSITRAGLDVLRRLDRPVVDTTQQVLGRLGPKRLSQLNALLDTVIDYLDPPSPDSPGTSSKETT